MSKLAILGLGAMGSRMARAAIDRGHQVTVWNRTAGRAAVLQDAGARLASSPRQAVDGADFVFAMVRDDEASRAIWLDPRSGALDGMEAGAVAIESSTLSVSWVQDLAREVALRPGVCFLDAPVAGSRPQADSRQLIFLVGGDADIVARAEPVLRTMGSVVHHAGPAGAGAALKLAVNALLGVQVAALAEVLGALAKFGISPAAVARILGDTPVCSVAAKAAAASMVEQRFAPLFPAELAEKDLGYLDAFASGIGARVPLSQAAHAVLASAVARGFGAGHLTGVVRLYLDQQDSVFTNS